MLQHPKHWFTSWGKIIMFTVTRPTTLWSKQLSNDDVSNELLTQKTIDDENDHRDSLSRKDEKRNDILKIEQNVRVFGVNPNPTAPYQDRTGDLSLSDAIVPRMDNAGLDYETNALPTELTARWWTLLRVFTCCVVVQCIIKTQVDTILGIGIFLVTLDTWSPKTSLLSYFIYFRRLVLDSYPTHISMDRYTVNELLLHIITT